MKKSGNRVERREFGRRKTVIHAWAFPRGRARVPCIIRNISTTGALLEFAFGAPKAESFRLVVPSLQQEWTCDVRHRRPKLLGVYFDFMSSIVMAPATEQPTYKNFPFTHSGRKIHGMPMCA